MKYSNSSHWKSFYWNFPKSCMKDRPTNNEYIEEKGEHIWTKLCLTKLWGWDKCILMFTRLLLHIRTAKHFSVFFFEKIKVTRRRKKKLSSLIRDHYLLDSFSHVSTFPFSLPLFLPSPLDLPKNSIPKLESTCF